LLDFSGSSIAIHESNVPNDFGVCAIAGAAAISQAAAATPRPSGRINRTAKWDTPTDITTPTVAV
jgi:hypothetical protein